MSHPLELEFRAVDEPEPGAAWQATFDETWPAYRQWFRREGDGARPTYAECRRAMHEHLPELVPTWEALVDLAGGGDQAARFLSLYRPTPYLAGCSQAVWRREIPALVRNYDYAPDLCEGLLLRSTWNDRRTIASSDCLWGVLDGMSEAGLAVSLAFGGRRVVGEGFGITLVLRLLLETCDDAAAARAALERVPVHMAYNVTVLDRKGAFFTAYVGPDRPALVRTDPVATNHQRRVEWTAHASFTGSPQREQHLLRSLEDADLDRDGFAVRFLEPPLFRRSYDRGWGTLYTAIYDPTAGTAELRWPDAQWVQSMDDFPERRHLARYVAAAPVVEPFPFVPEN